MRVVVFCLFGMALLGMALGACGGNDPAQDAGLDAQVDAGLDAGDSMGDEGPAVAPLSTLNCEMSERPGLDIVQPQVLIADFSAPRRLPDSINTPCPQDAVEMSPDGRRMIFHYSVNLIDTVLIPEGRFIEGTEVRFQEQLQDGDWEAARVLDLRRGDPEAGCAEPCSAPGETWVAPDGSRVIYHALGPNCIGYKQGLPEGQFFDLDLYEAPMTNMVPGDGVALKGINSEYIEGEQWVTGGGHTLIFASNRPGGQGGIDLWRAERTEGGWSASECLPAPVNSAGDEKQAVISPDGQWIYFASDRSGITGIWRVAIESDGSFGAEAEAVITGYVGEPSFTEDGRLFFVHVEVYFGEESWEVVDSDIYCVEPSDHVLPCTQWR